ncbi:MAG: hypothetical protein IJJ98_13660 [Prevotella sp.]|nr:hypothetical protein [Prevotella sp.]
MDNNVEGTKKSSERIAEGINKYMEKLDKVPKNESKAHIYLAAREFISSFPVPSNKEELIDFILYLDERRKSGMFQNEFLSKWKESNKKAVLLFPNDPSIISLTKESSSKKWSNLSSNQKFIRGYGLALIILIVVILLGLLIGL